MAVTAEGQTSRGALSGVVTDASGGAVQHASIVLTQQGTGVRRTSVSNDAGFYRFEAIDPGAYTLEVSHAGFKLFVATSINVSANRTTTLDPTLEVGSETIRSGVSAEEESLLIREGPLRGGNFNAEQVTRLPLPDLNPVSLARTLPGVIRPSGTFSFEGGGEVVQFSINGQRVRSNNFLLDGVDNNDIAFTGIAQPFNIQDAVQEVSVQASNFAVEFGRASGGVINLVTRSGTNALHGTALLRYQSQRFNSTSNLDKITSTPQAVFSHNVYGFTVGGPIIKDKTFFFAAYQQNVNRSTMNFRLTVPTAATVDRLRLLFPSNSRLDLYLRNLGEMRGSAAPIELPLGPDPNSGLDRGFATFGAAHLGLSKRLEGPQAMLRADHHSSLRHRVSLRVVGDSRLSSPENVLFPGYVLESGAEDQNILLADTHTFSASYINELRLSYSHLAADQSRISPSSVAGAAAFPRLVIQNISAPGVPSGLPYRRAHNALIQQTQTKLAGRHTFRYGLEVLRQIAKQRASGYPLGEYTFTDSPGYSAFANFLDNFSGASGRMRLTMGGGIFRPNLWRHSWFFQDTWKTTSHLTLTLGLRYENFGQPANAVRHAAFTGFDPEAFFRPSRVNRDDNNFGPAAGFAWTPPFESGWLRRIIGQRSSTVWRGGYQISYQALYTQLVSLDLATSAPNAVAIDERAPSLGRGSPNWFGRLGLISPRAPTLLDTQYGALEKNFRTPYTERWSLGLQRQLASRSVLDLAYVGAGTHKLTTRVDVNPRQPNGTRLHAGFGPRTIRTSEGNSVYHSLQTSLQSRFSDRVLVSAAYTWSKSLDSTSEGIGQVNTQYTNANLTSVPVAQGGLKIDRALSDFHRGHNLTLTYVWSVPGPSAGVFEHVLGGWSLAGIVALQSGAPYTILNGSDRNSDGWLGDRPDISNPAAPRNSRGVLWPTGGPQGCATGYRDPDRNICVTPADVYWIEGIGQPNSSTVGRNTLFTNGIRNVDVSVSRSFLIRDCARLELRWEAFNALNHAQFTDPPDAANRDIRSALGAQAGSRSRFLNRDFTDMGIRRMWLQLKVLF